MRIRILSQTKYAVNLRVQYTHCLINLGDCGYLALLVRFSLNDHHSIRLDEPDTLVLEPKGYDHCVESQRSR